MGQAVELLLCRNKDAAQGGRGGGSQGQGDHEDVMEDQKTAMAVGLHEEGVLF